MVYADADDPSLILAIKIWPDVGQYAPPPPSIFDGTPHTSRAVSDDAMSINLKIFDSKQQSDDLSATFSFGHGSSSYSVPDHSGHASTFEGLDRRACILIDSRWPTVTVVTVVLRRQHLQSDDWASNSRASTPSQVPTCIHTRPFSAFDQTGGVASALPCTSTELQIVSDISCSEVYWGHTAASKPPFSFSGVTQ